MKDKKQHLVAISAIWYERYLECSRTHGTPHFTSSVWRFYHSLLNIDQEKLNIKNQVKNYMENKWRPRLHSETVIKLQKDHISPTDITNIDLYSKETEEDLIVELFEFIIQTIQDSGVGWPTREEITQYMITQE